MVVHNVADAGDLYCHHRLCIPGSHGIHVGEDQVAGAVCAEPRFVFPTDYGEGVEHVLRVFLGQAVEVEVERVEGSVANYNARIVSIPPTCVSANASIFAYCIGTTPLHTRQETI